VAGAAPCGEVAGARHDVSLAHGRAPPGATVVDYGMPKVLVGFFSFTEITDPTQHVAYNAWHQLDHMPEQYPLPGVAHGERWVSTPACRAARAAESPRLAPVHYMTLYLMGEPLERTLEEFRSLGEQLRQVGRFHEHRRARLSGPFEVTGMHAAPRVLVSDEAVAFRPNRGVYVVVTERAEAGPGAGRAADAVGGLVPRLLETPGVAGVWTFTGSDRFSLLGWRPGGCDIAVCFLDVEPLAVADRLGGLATGASAPTSPVEFAGPFETVTPWRWDWFEPETPRR